MNHKLLRLKNEKNKLPYFIPGHVLYQDFSEKRFQIYESNIFIRPVLFIQASLPDEFDNFCFPGKDDCCVILYIKEGSVKIERDEKNFDLNAGSGILVSADLPIYFKHTEGSLSCLFLLLTGDLLWELYKVENENLIGFTGYQFPDFEERFNSLLCEYVNAESPLLFDFSRHMDHLLSRMIHQSIQKKYDIEKEKKQSLMRVITYMKEHCCEQIQVGDIATAFGYSSSHFSRIFQAEFHQSPKKYLIELRLAHAEKLLTTSDLSVEIIGQKCGFNTTTYFIQTFRDLHDMTPLQYRKRLGK